MLGGWPTLNPLEGSWVAHPCGFVLCKGGLFASLSRRSFTPCLFILAMGHLLRHVQNELAVFLVGLSQQTAQFIQVPPIFP